MAEPRESPHYLCPACERLASLVVSDQQAFCSLEECEVITFDPMLRYTAEDLANAHTVDFTLDQRKP